MSSGKVFSYCFVVFGFWLLGTNQPVVGQATKFSLKNGIRVIVNPIPESAHVAMETAYEVGFVDEPRGMVQASHLLEHLVCYGPGAGFQQKEAFEWLNRSGMANAETLPDWTHYDYMVSADNLDKILEIEASRLGQTNFDRQLLRSESSRVYLETDMVERNPRTGMAKHAFMAILHALRFQSESALVRGGLEEFKTKDLFKFYQRFYQPNNLTIVITGKTTVAEAKSLVQKHLGHLKKRYNDFDSPIPWSDCPKKQTIKWDADARGVCVVWRPSVDSAERTILSILSTLAYQRMATDKEISSVSHMAMCSNNIWPVGDVPLFAYASARSPGSLADVEATVSQTFERLIRKQAQAGMAPVNSLIKQLEFSAKADWQTIQRHAKILERRGMSAERSIQMVFGQIALNQLIRERMFGGDVEAVRKRIEAFKKQDLVQLVEKTLNEQNRRVVFVIPSKPN